MCATRTAGSKQGEEALPNPASDWLTDKSWQDILALSDLPAYSGFAKHMISHLDHYKAMFDSNQVHTMPLAPPFASSLTPFQLLLVLRCLRPDKVLAGIQNYVAASMGQHFIEPPPFDLKRCFKESQPSTPLIFVLSSGTQVAAATASFWPFPLGACSCSCAYKPSPTLMVHLACLQQTFQL
jgi:dynein heavy chain